MSTLDRVRTPRGAGTAIRPSSGSSRSGSSGVPGSTWAESTRSSSRGRSRRRGRATSRSCSSATRRARCARSSTSAGTAARSSAPARACESRSSARTTPDVRARRHAAEGAPAWSTRSQCPRRTGSASCSSGSRRGGRSRSSTPTLRGNHTRRGPRRHPCASRRRGHRRRRAVLPRALGVRDRRELEDLRRELPRVLPLPDGAPGVLGGCRRLAGELPWRPTAGACRRSARCARAPRRVPPRRGGGARTVPLRLPEHRRERHARPAEHLDRADRPACAGAHVPCLDYLVARDADEAWVSDMLAFDAQVGDEDRVLVERVQVGVLRAPRRGRLARVRAPRRALPSLVLEALA